MRYINPRFLTYLLAYLRRNALKMWQN